MVHDVGCQPTDDMNFKQLTAGAALLASVVPIYFISGAVQPIVADSIAAEGGHG